MSSVSPTHTEHESQRDSVVIIKDFVDNSTQNINPLIEANLKKILKNSTTTTQLYTNPILVRLDEIEKEKLASTGEKPQETSNVPPQSTEVKEIDT